MPIVKQRVLSRGEIHELKRLQAIYRQRVRRLPRAADHHRTDFYRPRLLDRPTGRPG